MPGRLVLVTVSSLLALSQVTHAETAVLETSSSNQDATSFQLPKVPPAPIQYAAVQAQNALTIDGKLDEPDWISAAQTPRFVDLISGNETAHKTHAAILWDSDFLYAGYWLEEPNVSAKYKDRDDPIYFDNDVELFIAGKDAYYELETNAYGTIYEAFFVWKSAYQSGSYATDKQLRPSAPKSQPFNGVGFTSHPRGERIVFLGYDMPGIQVAVHVDGTLNDDSDTDRGWTVEFAIPWQSMKWLAAGDQRSLPPKPGDQWQINLFRFNSYKTSAKDSGGWAVAPHRVWDSHIPELFPLVTFAEKRE